MLNRGKQSLVLDLKNDADRSRLLPLLKRADVLVEQFRPGVMRRLRPRFREPAQAKSPHRLLLDYGLRTIGTARRRSRSRPQLHRQYRATFTTARAARPAGVPPALIADIGGGSLPAVINILLGLRQRELTGKGCAIDIAMADAMFTFASPALATTQATGRFPRPWWRAADRRLTALPALRDQGRKACGLRCAGTEILARIHGRDRPSARGRGRPPRS